MYDEEINGDPNVFLVQFTEQSGGAWKEDSSYKTEQSARQRLDLLIYTGKTSARVLRIIAYDARPIEERGR